MFLCVSMHARCLFGECVCVLMYEGMSSILDGIRLALSILCKTGFGANQLVLADWLAGCCPESPGDHLCQCFFMCIVWMELRFSNLPGKYFSDNYLCKSLREE